jgi:Cu+-exporting ATPase
MGKAASNGVLFKSGESIEVLSKVSVAVFDKTGTLTQGRPSVTDVFPLNEGSSATEVRQPDLGEPGVLQLAATAEQYSEHPLGKALLSAANSKGILPMEVDDFQMAPGMGVTATSGLKKIRVGNAEFMKSADIPGSKEVRERMERLESDGKTVVLVALDSRIVALVGLQDTPRVGAKDAIERLKNMGIEPVMLTGDSKRTANVIAQQVGLESVYAGVLPAGKAEVVRELQKSGQKVVMIGDGFNDAPALTVADVGIAMGAGTDLAIEAGGVILVRDDLDDIIAAVQIARKVVSKIKQNLAYAFMYNLVLVPIAGFGLLYPALAGLAMAASSVSVTASSLALKRWNPSN